MGRIVNFEQIPNTYVPYNDYVDSSMVITISNCFACLASLLLEVSQLTFLQTPADAWPPLIPVWLLVSGSLVVLAPAIYSVYDVFCKQEEAVSKGESGNIRFYAQDVC